MSNQKTSVDYYTQGQYEKEFRVIEEHSTEKAHIERKPCTFIDEQFQLTKINIPVLSAPVQAERDLLILDLLGNQVEIHLHCSPLQTMHPPSPE